MKQPAPSQLVADWLRTTQGSSVQLTEVFNVTYWNMVFNVTYWNMVFYVLKFGL